MDLRDLANFPWRISGIALDDHLAHLGAFSGLHDEVQFDALMLRVESGIHSDRRTEVPAFCHHSFHPLDAGGDFVFIELMPQLQLARIDQLIGSRRAWGAVNHNAADEQLFIDYEHEVEAAIWVRYRLCRDGLKSSSREQLPNAGAQVVACQRLTSLDGQSLQQVGLVAPLRGFELHAANPVSRIAADGVAGAIGFRFLFCFRAPSERKEQQEE